MHVKTKNRLISLSLVLFFLFVAIGTILHNPNTLKPLLTEWIKAHYQRTLTINGDIQLSLYPSLEIKLGPLTLSEHKQDAIFLTVRNSHISLSFAPLFRKELIAHVISTSGLQITLIRYQDGRTNFSDLITPKDNDSLTGFNLNQAHITDTTLQYHDHLNKQSISLTQLNVAINQVTPHSFEHVRLTTQGQIKTHEPILLTHQLTAKMHATRGHFDTERLSSGKIDLSFKINNSRRQLSGDLLISDITYVDNQYKSHLTANLDFKGMGQTALINLDTSFAGQLKDRTLILPDLSTHLTYTNATHPELPIRSTISGHVTANASSEQINATLTGKIQNSSFNALLSTIEFNNPALRFNINIDQLNTDQFFPPITETVSTQTIKNKKDTEEKIDLSFLRTLNAKGQIHIGTLHTNDIQSSDILFTVQSAGDKSPINLHP